MNYTVSVSAIMGALIAALCWMFAALLLILHTDSLVWDVTVIGDHLLHNYTLMLLGVLVVVDIALDIYILKSEDNLFVNKRDLAWKVAIWSAISVFGATIVSATFEPVWADIAMICTLFALFLLFVLRFLSYIRITLIEQPVRVSAGGDAPEIGDNK